MYINLILASDKDEAKPFSPQRAVGCRYFENKTNLDDLLDLKE